MGAQHALGAAQWAPHIGEVSGVAQRLWSRPYIAAIIANLFMPSAFYLLLTTMAGYAISAFGASDALAGFASSSFVVGSIFGRIGAGKFLDFLGRRRLLLQAMVAYVLVSLAYILVQDLWLLIALRLVHGVAFGAGNTALVASVQSIIPPTRRSEGNGYFSTATTVSTALGPFLAVTLSSRFGYDAVFVAAAAAGAAALIAGWFFTVPERALDEADRARLRSWELSTFLDAGALRIGAVIGLAGFAVAAVMGFIALHSELLQIPGAASLFFVAYALASLAARLVTGRVQDRRGDNIVVFPVFGFFIAGLLLLAWGTTTPAIVLAGALTGIGFGSLLPSLLAIVVKATPPARVGVATSTFYLFLDIGAGIGPVALGLVITAAGFPAMFLAAAGIAAAGGVYYAVSHGRASADPARRLARPLGAIDPGAIDPGAIGRDTVDPGATGPGATGPGSREQPRE